MRITYGTLPRSAANSCHEREGALRWLNNIGRIEKDSTCQKELQQTRASGVGENGVRSRENCIISQAVVRRLYRGDRSTLVVLRVCSALCVCVYSFALSCPFQPQVYIAARPKLFKLLLVNPFPRNQPKVSETSNHTSCQQTSNQKPSFFFFFHHHPPI